VSLHWFIGKRQTTVHYTNKWIDRKIATWFELVRRWIV